MTLDDAIRNWQRWCLDLSDCYPIGYPPEWPMGRVYLPYKVMISEDEAIEELERTREPDRIWAERVERWVHSIPARERVAVQTHYIHWPESMGSAWELTRDQLDERRARRLSRVAGGRPDVDEYHRTLGSGRAALGDLLARWLEAQRENA